MPRDNYSQIYSIPTGNQLESDLKNAIYDYFLETDGIVRKTVFRAATKEEDRKQGTDAFIYGLPCDFTSNFHGKDNMIELEAKVLLFGGIGSVRFGVRTSNSAGLKFQTPVLVIGIDVGYLSKSFISTVVDAVRDKIAEIIEIGQDAYWIYCDQSLYKKGEAI